MRFGPQDLWNRIVVKARNFNSVRDCLKLNKDKPRQEQNQQNYSIGKLQQPKPRWADSSRGRANPVTLQTLIIRWDQILMKSHM